MSTHCFKSLVASCVVLFFLGGAACTSPASPESAPEKEEVGKAPAKEPVAARDSAPAAAAAVAESPQGAKEAESKPVPAVPASPPLSPECNTLLEQIRALDKAVPFVFDRVKDQNQLNQDMVQAIEACRRFIKACPGAEASCEVSSILCRLLFERNLWYRKELEEQKLQKPQLEERMKAYFEEIMSTAQGAGEACPSGSRARHMALWVLMEAASTNEQNDKALEVGLKLLADNPEDDIRTGAIEIVGWSYYALKRYEDSVKYLREAASKYSSDEYYVVYNIRLHEAMNAAGDLEGMEELMHLIRAEYPTRVPSVKDELLRSQYDQWYHRSLFELGFVRMALGDKDGAEQYFNQYIAEVDNLADQLKGEGKQIDSVLPVIRDFRARTLLNYLGSFYGKVPSVDFDLQDMWATQKTVTLKESRGKVVAVLFRRPGDRRAQGFLQALDRLVKEREKEGLVGLTLAFIVEKRTPDGDAIKIQNMIDDLKKQGVSLPAGFDPDSERQSIFRGTFATLGTASFAVFNRKGESAWFLQDPKEIDSRLAARVIDRLLKEGGAAAPEKK
jgi:tetratricopeptide (TPR) repeat protein